MGVRQYIKVLIFGTLMSVGAIGNAQQFPIMDQYLIAPATLAPSFVGLDSPFEAFLTSRIEWTNLSGRPFIGSFHLDGTLPKNMGIGANVMYNQAGPLENLTLNVDFAYHLKLALNHKLSFGINGTYYQNVLDLTNVVVADPNDPMIAGKSSISENYFNMGLSLLYSWKSLSACVAFPILFNNKTFYNTDKLYDHVLTMDRNFLVYLNYTLKKKKNNWGGQFTFLYRNTQYTPWSFDICARALYKEVAWLGLLYRKGNTLGITGGMNIARGIEFNYTFEYSPTAMMGKTAGTHEITIGYKLMPRLEKPSLQDYLK
jgi:type IX secretion system PorP/SprF family membrane protein